MRAVHLALLARAGQVGSPTALTMPRWGFYATTFGGREFDLPKVFDSWAIENIFFKIMPVEGHGISAVEAALIQGNLIRERGLDPVKDIANIEIRTNAAADMIINKTGTLTNPADRDHCMQYVVALAFLKGSAPEAQDFQDDSPWATSAGLAALRERTGIRADQQLTRDYLDFNKKSLASGVTVKLANGSVLDEVMIEFPVGHVQSSQTEARVREKFLNNMGLMFSSTETMEIIEAVEREDMSISSFVDLFVRKSHGKVKL